MAPQQSIPQNIISANGSLTPTTTHGLNAAPSSLIASIGYGSDANYDFFDPQHWMLDGLLDFNINNTFAQPLEI
jgi:hypothetical protein